MPASFAATLLAACLFASAAGAAEITVMISGGFSAAYYKLVPEIRACERAQGRDPARPLDGRDAAGDPQSPGARRNNLTS